MKKIRFLLIFMLLQTVSAVADSRMCFIVWGKDGTNVAYDLKGNGYPVVKFTDTDLIVKSDYINGIESHHALKDVTHFTYEIRDFSNIDKIVNERQSYNIEDGVIHFECLKANSMLSIYNIDGVLAYNDLISSGGEYSFPLSKLHKGVYLVKINNTTFKVSIR